MPHPGFGAVASGWRHATPDRRAMAPDKQPESPCSDVDTTRATGCAASLSRASCRNCRSGLCVRSKIMQPTLARDRRGLLGHPELRHRVCAAGRDSGKVRSWNHRGSRMTRLAFIGGGNMARSLIGGLLKTGVAPATVSVAEPNAEGRQALGRDFGVACYADNRVAAADAEVIVLAVKPQVMPAIHGELHDTLQRNRPLLISIAAGVRLDQLERWFGSTLPIVRCMPNTPALIGSGATGLCANNRVSPAQKAQAQHILDAAGLTRWIDDEALMDTVTAVSGSGPAYFFALVEALEDAAVAQGLPRDTARALAAQTCFGAGRMLIDSGEDPAVLRQRVTSPNGTTQAALESFGADGLPRMVARAVAAATRRGAELAAELDRQS